MLKEILELHALIWCKEYNLWTAEERFYMNCQAADMDTNASEQQLYVIYI